MTDLALDARGNALVVGASFGKGTGRDYVTLKVRANGSRAWARRYAGPDFVRRGPRRGRRSRRQRLRHRQLEAQAGRSRAGPARPRTVTIKYSPSGARLWLAIVGQRRHASGSAVMVSPDARGAIVSGWRDLPGECGPGEPVLRQVRRLERQGRLDAHHQRRPGLQRRSPRPPAWTRAAHPSRPG